MRGSFRLSAKWKKHRCVWDLNQGLAGSRRRRIHRTLVWPKHTHLLRKGKYPKYHCKANLLFDGLDLNKQVIMFKFNINNAAKMQTNLTWRTPHSDTSPYTLSEYSLVWQFPHFTLWLFLIENTSMIRYIFLDLCTLNRAGVKICLKMFAKKILVFFFFLNCTIFIYMSHLQFMYTWDHSRDS